MINKRVALFLFLVNLIISTPVLAQVERLPGVIDDPTPELDIPVEREGDPLQPEPTFEAVPGANEPVASFDNVNFTGLTVIDEAILQEVVRPYLNRTITKGELARLKFELTKVFFDEGYILVKVVTPPQDLNTGTLQIDIYEAQVGQINIENNEVLNNWIANQMVRQLEQGEIFDESSAESMISDINDLKNIAATLNLQPGQRFKTTDLNVFISEAEEDEQRITIDNYGSELTGTGVATLHLEKSNLLNLGETLYTNLRHSDDELWSVEVGANTPIGFRNIILELTALHSENDIGDRLTSLNASGETDSATIAFSSNLLNTRDDKATVRVGFEARHHESFLSDATDTNDNIRKVFIEGSALHRTDGAAFYAQARLSRGVDIFGASEKGDALATRAAGEPDAVLFQPLVFATFRPFDFVPFEVPVLDGAIKMLATGQLASETVLSSDLFVLGGYGSVRGYEPAQETGESGYSFSIEYGQDIPVSDDFTVTFGPFIDGGSVYNRIDGSTEDDHLYSAGLGLEVTTSLVPAGDTTLRMDLAHPLGAYSSNEVQEDTFYFRLTQAF